MTRPTMSTPKKTASGVSTGRSPVKEPDPSDKERAMMQAILYDSLLGAYPLVAMNVRAGLQILLNHLGRPKLGLMAEQL